MHRPTENKHTSKKLRLHLCSSNEGNKNKGNVKISDFLISLLL